MIHLICPNPAVDRTLLIDHFVEGMPNRPYDVKEFPGGKSFNVAYALLRKDPSKEVIVHTMLGGKNGERVIDLAQQAGYQVQWVAVDKNTRECNIAVDTAQRTIYPIYEKGFDLQPKLLEEYTQQLIDHIKDDDWIVFSGSLMQGMPKDYIASLQQKIANPTVKFFVDTSGEELRQAYEKAELALLKINDEEYNQLFNTELKTVDEFADHLRQMVQVDYPVIVTLGSKGAVAKEKDQLYYFKAAPIEVKNPVASGDHFLGSYLDGLSQSLSFVELVKQSMAYATVNCLYWFPFVDLDQVEKIKQTIDVVEL